MVDVPKLAWFSGLGNVPQSNRLPVRFPVGVRVWIVDQVPGWGPEKRPSHVSLAHSCFCPSVSLPSPLSKNK